jgi:hypothetical protein
MVRWAHNLNHSGLVAPSSTLAGTIFGGANVRRRATLVQMAQVWLRLAKEQDESVPPIEQDRPAVQRQQQVQPKDDDKKVE